MKKLMIIFLSVAGFTLVSCDSGTSRTERTVLDTDTVDAETEYEIEREVREKTVEIDTVTETETITSEEDTTMNNQ